MNSYLNETNKQDKSSHTLVISSNVAVVKKDKKQGDRNPSQVKCYACYRKDHYASKCPNKKPKN